MMIRVGPAGWDYKDWKGIVYPDPAPRRFDPLVYLAGYFDTLEINSTHYRPMAGTVARRWCERVAENPQFRFTAKLWRRFTHERDSAFSAEDVRVAREAFEAMAEQGRLGAVLLQFPWSFKRTEENREWLGDVTRAFRGLPLVLEIRHRSWNVPDLYLSLTEEGIGFVNIDQPLFHDSIRPSAIATSPVGYVRVHGRNYRDWFRENAGRDARYDYLYSAGELQPWAASARTLEKSRPVKEVYLITNNHFRGQAAANAKMLEAMIEHRRVKAPRELVDSYHEVLAPFVEPEAREQAPEPAPL